MSAPKKNSSPLSHLSLVVARVCQNDVIGQIVIPSNQNSLGPNVTIELWIWQTGPNLWSFSLNT